MTIDLPFPSDDMSEQHMTADLQVEMAPIAMGCQKEQRKVIRSDDYPSVLVHIIVLYSHCS